MWFWILYTTHFDRFSLHLGIHPCWTQGLPIFHAHTLGCHKQASDHNLFCQIDLADLAIWSTTRTLKPMRIYFLICCQKNLIKYIKKRNMRVIITETHRCVLHAINKHRAPVDIAFLWWDNGIIILILGHFPMQEDESAIYWKLVMLMN
jgi:hypothetical protein